MNDTSDDGVESRVEIGHQGVQFLVSSSNAKAWAACQLGLAKNH